MFSPPRGNRPNPITHLLIPHSGNSFRPRIIGATSLVALLFLVLVCEGGYLADTKLAFTKTNFLASVLPGVLISLTNQDRVASGAGELTESPLLDEAAQLKANDMAAKGYFAHVTPDGKEPWYWIDQAGYKYEYAGENLAVNFDDSQDVEQAWMASPTHHANIVKPQYTNIGIAVANGMYEGKDVTFVVQYFANPAPATTTLFIVATSTSNTASTLTTNISPKESSTTDVLGAETVQPVAPIPSKISPSSVVPAAHLIGLIAFLAEVAASPVHTILYIFSLLGLIAGILFIIALSSHLRARYLEALGGTAIVFAIIVGLLIFDIAISQKVTLPTDNLSASVVNAL